MVEVVKHQSVSDQLNGGGIRAHGMDNHLQVPDLLLSGIDSLLEGCGAPLVVGGVVVAVRLCALRAAR